MRIALLFFLGCAHPAPATDIKCETSEMVAFHIHAHLALFDQGEAVTVPKGIGIGEPHVVVNGFVVGGSCFSWLHTHDETGVIHIESPIDRQFTLGDFYSVWGRTIDGSVTAFVNGERWEQAPEDIPLTAHAIIQLDMGSPVVDPAPYTFDPRL